MNDQGIWVINRNKSKMNLIVSDQIGHSGLLTYSVRWH